MKTAILILLAVFTGAMQCFAKAPLSSTSCRILCRVRPAAELEEITESSSFHKDVAVENSKLSIGLFSMHDSFELTLKKTEVKEGKYRHKKYFQAAGNYFALFSNELLSIQKKTFTNAGTELVTICWNS